jgi:hypothetical protein
VVNQKIIEYRLLGKENVWPKVMMQRKTSKRKLKKHSKRNGLRKKPKEQASNLARVALCCLLENKPAE